jgi:glycosyltransferase involved in cell wall biosynthesis
MKILVVSPLLYYDQCGNGGGVVCYNLLKGLATHCDITFIAFGSADSREDEVALKALKAICSEVHVVSLPTPSRLDLLIFRFRQWLGGPPTEAQTLDDKAMHRRIQGVVSANKFDAGIIQFPYMAQYIADFDALPGLLDVQDVFFVSRLREYVSQRAPLPRLKRLVSWLSWVRYELQWYRRFRVIMSLTEADRAALHHLVPGVPAFVNHAVISARVPVKIQAAKPGRVGFAGNFSHPPNRDALKWLSNDIAPALQKLAPGVEIAVAGRGIPEELKEGLHPCIRLLGFVEDYDAFMASCVAFLAPLQFGGGVKIKVLEALACGRPVVTTPIGAEGIELRRDEGLLVGNTALELAQLVAEILQAPTGAASAAARGSVRIAEAFGLPRAVDQLERALSHLSADSSHGKGETHLGFA